MFRDHRSVVRGGSRSEFLTWSEDLSLVVAVVSFSRVEVDVALAVRARAGGDVRNGVLWFGTVQAGQRHGSVFNLGWLAAVTVGLWRIWNENDFWWSYSKDGCIFSSFRAEDPRKLRFKGLFKFTHSRNLRFQRLLEVWLFSKYSSVIREKKMIFKVRFFALSLKPYTGLRLRQFSFSLKSGNDVWGLTKTLIFQN